MKLDRYIQELLIENDNIIIKNLGAFEKTLESAVIDEKSGQIQPPHMTIKFDGTLKTDSGKLSKYVAAKERISEEEVIKNIAEIVGKWEEDLKAGKLISFEGLGMLSQDKAGVKNFDAQIQPGSFPDMYGLPVLSVEETSQTRQNSPTKDFKKKPVPEKKDFPIKKPVSEKKNIVAENKTVPEKKVVTEKEIIPEKKLVSEKKVYPGKKKTPEKPVRKPIRRTTTTAEDEKKAKKTMLTALIVIPIIILVVLGALNFDFVTEKFNNSSEYVGNLLSGNDVDTQTDVNIDTSQVSNTDEIDNSQNETEAVLENFTIINAETNESVPPKTENLVEFHKVEVIAGSFRSSRNAKKFRNQLNNKGFTAKILPRSKGLYRVSVGSFDDVELVAKEIANIQELDPNINVWLLVK
ncbi:MAG: hypothetical protein DRI95_03375 [Bacteroidetes bacterium]|nr:MAG: hypothetical protein DRI95_03375 [Bacteroidota bacterium]RLD86504.1 MAG: hypothetical protein DRJ07_00570 [Bacteroidota bacterium]